MNSTDDILPITDQSPNIQPAQEMKRVIYVYTRIQQAQGIFEPLVVRDDDLDTDFFELSINLRFAFVYPLKLLHGYFGEAIVGRAEPKNPAPGSADRAAKLCLDQV